MSEATSKKPLSDLMFDWLTVLQNKAQGVAAYDKYVKDAEAANATKCLAMLKKIREQDIQMLEEVKKHVFGMIAESHTN